MLQGKAADWLASTRTLDAALADAVTVAADDVLLPGLLEQISTVPYARAALLGLSVFREPVDVNALLFQIGRVDETAARNPDRQGAEERIQATLTAHHLDRAVLDQALAGGDLASLPPDAVSALLPELQERYGAPTPPRVTDADIEHLVGVLADSTLLTVDAEAGTRFVHRWTADELARIARDADSLHRPPPKPMTVAVAGVGGSVRFSV